MKNESIKIPKGAFSFLFSVSGPYKFPAFIAVSAVAIASTIGSVVPYIFKRIIDTITGISGIGPENIWFWASLYVLAGLLSALGWRMSGFAGMRWATGVRATGRERLTEYVSLHGYNYFSNRFAGSIGTKLKTASEGLKSIVSDTLWGWLSFLIQLVISLALVFYTNAYIGWVFVAWLLFISPINIFLFKKKVRLGLINQEADTKLTGQTVDVLTNINAMHDYARREHEMKRMKKAIELRRTTGLNNWSYSEKVLTLNSVLEAIFVGGMIFASIYMWDIGAITAGDIILVITLVISIRGNLGHLGQRFNEFAEQISQVKEGLTDILREHDIKDSEEAKNLEITAGEISIENVSFGYESENIFKNLSLKIKPGERVGLIGHSGAGKSTLMKLLTRQYDVTRGQILIDGQNISSVKQKSLREAITTVPQEPLLFHRSLRENIIYGDTSASEEEMIKAAKMAQAHNFINSLPKKYETLVGERGIKLSGGERQRVVIARAFLKNSSILLLDEATSALDSESEILIQEALQKLMEGKTVIAIAHRLSTLRAMDRLIVMDDGKVVEDGTHEELLKKDGIYASLWAHQAGGFIKDE